MRALPVVIDEREGSGVSLSVSQSASEEAEKITTSKGKPVTISVSKHTLPNLLSYSE